MPIQTTRSVTIPLLVQDISTAVIGTEPDSTVTGGIIGVSLWGTGQQPQQVGSFTDDTLAYVDGAALANYSSLAIKMQGTPSRNFIVSFQTPGSANAQGETHAVCVPKLPQPVCGSAGVCSGATPKCCLAINGASDSCVAASQVCAPPPTNTNSGTNANTNVPPTCGTLTCSGATSYCCSATSSLCAADAAACPNIVPQPPPGCSPNPCSGLTTQCCMVGSSRSCIAASQVCPSIVSPSSVNLNSNGNTNSNPNTTTYYVDVDGNLYTDSALVNRVSTAVDCKTVTTKAFAPTTLTGITSAPDYDYGEGQWFYVLKNSMSGGAYSKLNGFEGIGEQQYGWKMPAFFFHRRMNAGTPGSAWDFPTTKVNVKNGLNTTQLCVPGKSLATGEYQVYFYDTLGKPYSDLFLQQPVACGAPTTCTTVKCSSDPTNPCCLQLK